MWYFNDVGTKSEINSINISNIDTTVPAIEVKANEGTKTIESGKTSANSIKVIGNDTNIKEILYDNGSGFNAASLQDGEDEGKKEAVISVSKGTYKFKVTDTAGNESEVITVVVVDVPEIELKTATSNKAVTNDSVVNESVNILVTGGDTDNIKLDIDGSKKNVTSFTVEDEGTHTVYAEDIYGSVSESITFEIDKTAPSITVTSAESTVNVLNGSDNTPTADDKNLFTSANAALS